MRTHLKTFLLPGLAALLIGCSGSDPITETPVDDPMDPMDPMETSIVDVATAAGTFDTLVAALAATGLDAVLSDTDSTFTVFAPTDEAFDALPDGTLEALLADPETLSDILLYHVVSGAEIDATAATAAVGTTVGMANMDSVAISMSGMTLNVNLATVIDTDIDGGNGIIHVLDTVLLPPAEAGEPTANIVETAIAAGSFETLVTAVVAAGLDGALADPDANYTVFAPTDDAFALLGDEAITALLADIPALTTVLSRHVIAGEAAVDSVTAFSLAGNTAVTLGDEEVALSIVDGQLLINNAAVEMFDIYTTNGVIHVIDAVIEGAAEESPENIVDVARAAGGFTTLIAALEATSLDAVLSNTEGTFTVFAPNDAAFAALPDGTLDALLADTDTLSDILLYHVVSGAEISSAAAIAAVGTTVEMANMDSVGISMSGAALNVNTAEVIGIDIDGINGVIHVLDSVLLPPAPTEPTGNIVETAIANGNFETLVTAVVTAGLDGALADPDANYTVFAPTDDAFALLGDEAITALLADIPALTAVLSRHVIAGEAAVDSVTAFSLAGNAVTTLGDEDVNLSIADGQLLVNNASVTMYDVVTTNGIIHVIDAVIEGGDTGGDASAIVDFEGGVDSVNFDFFDGGFSEVVANPDMTGNDSAFVALQTKDGGQPWGGSGVILDTPVDVPANAVFTAMAWSQRAVPVNFKFEAPDGNVQSAAVNHTGSGWELLTFDMADAVIDAGAGNGPGDVPYAGATKLVIFFDINVVGDWTNDPDNWTFYYDDFTLLP